MFINHKTRRHHRTDVRVCVCVLKRRWTCIVQFLNIAFFFRRLSGISTYMWNDSPFGAAFLHIFWILLITAYRFFPLHLSIDWLKSVWFYFYISFFLFIPVSLYISMSSSSSFCFSIYHDFRVTISYAWPKYKTILSPIITGLFVGRL